MMNSLTVSLLLSFGSTILANNPIPESTFVENPGDAANQAAPLWLLPSGSCFPSAASWNGKQSDGNDPDNCNILKLDHNCPAQPGFGGAYTKAHDFPTYYMVRKCPDLNQWRILYDVWFTKDTGHRSDWEWAVMVFTQDSNGDFIRDSVITENEGKKGYDTWSNIPEAFTSNYQNNDGSNGDHAKLYISKWHHSVHTTSHTNTFKNTCPPSGDADYRSNDYYWLSSDWLEDGSTLDTNWNWGKADSFPANFGEGKNYDICTAMHN